MKKQAYQYRKKILLVKKKPLALFRYSYGNDIKVYRVHNALSLDEICQLLPDQTTNCNPHTP